MKSKKPTVFILTIDEDYFIPKTIFPLIKEDSIKIVGLGIMSPALGKQSYVYFMIKLLYNFGFHFFIQNAAFYAKCKIFNWIYILSGKNKTLSLRRIAKTKKIPVMEINDVNSPKVIKKVREKNPDVILSVAATQIFKEKLIESSILATINVHSSLLPAYRGVSPSFWSILNEEQFSGITVHYIDTKLDSGDIIQQKRIKLNKDETVFSLNSKVAKETSPLLINVINQIKDNKVERKPINIDKGSYFSLPNRKDIRKFKKKGKRFY